MKRVYGDEQRAAVREIREELIEQIESLYLKKFEQLNNVGLGDGMVGKVTQLLLISRDAAIAPLQEEVEGRSKTSY